MFAGVRCFNDPSQVRSGLPNKAICAAGRELKSVAEPSGERGKSLTWVFPVRGGGGYWEMGISSAGGYLVSISCG